MKEAALAASFFNNLFISPFFDMFAAPELLEKLNAYLADAQFSRAPLHLYEPISYVLSMGGKRLRPVLMLMAYNLYKDDVDTILNQAVGIEIYHNHTLLHDDLMDRAKRRRGHETVHEKWDDNTAILSGDAMLLLAYRYMLQCPEQYRSEVQNLFTETAIEICEGQQLDMDFEKRLDVTAEEYLEMIRLKTSVLLATTLKIGALLGGASAEDAESLYAFGQNLGLAFQLKDDLLDVYGDPAVFGKNIGGDILCNKKTYLLIKALELAAGAQQDELKRWLLATEFSSQEKIAGVTAIYNKVGVKELCEQKISEYSACAVENLSAVQMPDNRKKALLDLVYSLVAREA